MIVFIPHYLFRNSRRRYFGKTTTRASSKPNCTVKQPHPFLRPPPLLRFFFASSCFKLIKTYSFKVGCACFITIWECTSCVYVGSLSCLYRVKYSLMKEFLERLLVVVFRICEKPPRINSPPAHVGPRPRRSESLSRCFRKGDSSPLTSLFQGRLPEDSESKRPESTNCRYY